jgi:hypothetical protein
MSFMEAPSLLRQNYHYVDFIDTNDTNQRSRAGAPGPIRIIIIIRINKSIYLRTIDDEHA